jgi:hypothetical protein
MRIGARHRVALVIIGFVIGVSLSAAAGCSGSGLFRQYEYEEELYLSLDGSATMYVNSSIAALNALRGTTFDARPSARFDRDAYRSFFNSGNTHVTRVSTSRRSGRRFVHVRLDVDDVRRLGESAPFAWSAYRFERDGEIFTFRQAIDGANEAHTSAGAEDARGHQQAGVDPRWTGNELVAFRLHLPSKIEFHNTRRDIGRGNILVWEQLLADRLKGEPLVLEARMQTQSILYRTLWLFGLTFVLAALTFVVLIWWVVRRGRHQEQAPAQTAR